MSEKVAVTFLFASMVSVHVDVPVHAPLHPVKEEPELAAAVKTTDVPALYAFVQVSPQLIPEGLLVTVPEPVPDFVTVSILGAIVYVCVWTLDVLPAVSTAKYLSVVFEVMLRGDE